MRSRKVSGRRSSKQKKSRRNTKKRSLKTRVNILKKASDAYESYKVNKAEKQLNKAQEKKYEALVQKIRLSYKDRISKSQDKINNIKSKIKNKEDEKAYYTKQQEKKQEERKKLEGMKTKVGSDLSSLNKKIVDIKNERHKLEEKKRIKNEELINLIGERNIKLGKLNV